MAIDDKMTNKESILDLSLLDTQNLKGIALLMLLAHHVWGGANEGRFEDVFIHSEPLFRGIGAHCKVCVAIFVLLSGYGLTKSCLKKGGLGNSFSFFLHRYTKLMINYWLIWLLFVPIGLFFFGRTFPTVYGDNWIFKAITDFFGVFNLVNGHPNGYNATWWFYGLIIVLYLLFPLLWKLKNYWYIMIPISIILPGISEKIGLWGGAYL
jgi:surface polysaccharide O-acyltransferase-like enzyme